MESGDEAAWWQCYGGDEVGIVIVLAEGREG